jgi:spore germination protein YaaH
MRLRPIHGMALGVLTVFVGLGALVIFPAPTVRLQAVELDARPISMHQVTQVSPRPRLVVAIDRAIPATSWHITFDGKPVTAVDSGAPTRLLELALPGPLPLGSRHVIELGAPGLSKRFVFSVVPPLQATLSIRMVDLQADQPANVRVTVRFSQPVADRIQVQRLLDVTGATGVGWQDDSTLYADGTRLLGSVIAARLAAGVVGRDGSYTVGPVAQQYSVPSSITQVARGRLVQMYYVNTPDGHDAFFSHLDQIDMVSPAWYSANADASLTGYAHQDIIDVAHAHGIQIVPLIVNNNVDPAVAHAVLADPARRAALAANLASEARSRGYAGWQIDFEQVPWTDRDLLTALVQDCAKTFHPAGLSLSVAVIPRLAGDDVATGVMLDYFRAWSGAYDFPALARSADFLSFMTYDEHNGVTPPGPVSGIPWMRQALDFSLQGVPPEKVTLGLPTYDHDWTGVGRLTSSSVADALTLAQMYGATPAFDAGEDEMHFGYNAYGVHHELWYESADTLRRKLPMLYEYGLKGISVWRLGFEDPSFWNLIPSRR